LVYSEKRRSVSTALRREGEIKTWKKEKKEALVRGKGKRKKA
jgi:predicted GIY-YIG superfamily endonuclease